MIAFNRGRVVALGLVAAATLGNLAISWAQTQTPQRPGRASTTNTPTQTPAKPGEVGRLVEVRVPTNPTDPIATINGEIITRQQLADECVARKGQEILETLIARRLIQQAMRGKNLEITAAEIDAEIENVARTTAGVSREQWLLTLDKERGISPVTYARDIIWPALALKKLAAERVQVTPQDLKDAFEANFGERIRCRIIMVDNIRQATLIWNELQKNPAGFERLAKEQSRDNSTKASGGMLPEPIARHANPRNVADPAFKQLVDGNPDDKDSKGNPIKPKDGAITGPIQVHEAAWVIIKREELIPARSGANFNDPHIQTLLMEQMKEVKQNDAVASLFNDLMRASRIENKLTGQIKLANEEEHPDYKQGLDQNVSRTTADSVGQMPMKSGKQVPEKVTPNKPITPAGVPGEAASAANQLQNTIKSAPPGSSTPPGN